MHINGCPDGWRVTVITATKTIEGVTVAGCIFQHDSVLNLQPVLCTPREILECHFVAAPRRAVSGHPAPPRL